MDIKVLCSHVEQVLGNEDGKFSDDIPKLLLTIAEAISNWDYTGDEDTHNACIELCKQLTKAIDSGY